jgi:hypothetical protein
MHSLETNPKEELEKAKEALIHSAVEIYMCLHCRKMEEDCDLERLDHFMKAVDNFLDIWYLVEGTPIMPEALN